MQPRNAIAAPGYLIVRLRPLARAAVALMLLGWSALSVRAQVSIGASFDSARLNDPSIGSPSIPPDTNGAVGPDHYASFVNGRYTVFGKDGTLLLSRTDVVFWLLAGLSPPPFPTDPRIVYDPFTQRWFAAQLDDPGGQGRQRNNYLLAVSHTSNPLDGWKGYRIAANPGSGTLFADFTQLGLNADGVYIGTNMFTTPSQFFSGTNVLAVNKADLLNEVDAPSYSLSYNLNVNLTGAAAHPVVDLDNSGLPEAILSGGVSPSQTSALRLTQVTGSPDAFSYDPSDGLNVATTFYLRPPNASQPDTSLLIDTGDVRISGNVIKKNGEIWAVQNVQDPATGRAALRWVRSDAAAGTLIQEGLIADPNLDFYYGSVAVNDSGYAVIGFSGSGAPSDTFAGQYASAYAVAGKVGDDGTVAFGDPFVLQQGAGLYTVDFGGGRVRWGDYSATSVDPSDDPNGPFSFWTIQEYASDVNKWSTRVVQIIIDPTGF